MWERVLEDVWYYRDGLSAVVAEREGFVLGVLESGGVVRMFVTPEFGEGREDGGVV